MSGIALGVLAAFPACAQSAPDAAPPPPTAASDAAAATAAERAAQSAVTKKDASDITDEVLSTTAPNFAALGVSGQTITDPEGLKKAALALISGTDADGNPLTGIGIQFAPAQLIGKVDFEAYSDPEHPHRLFNAARAFARLQVTAAYAKATAGNAGKPERAGFGFLWVPFDTTDPFANAELQGCLNDAFIANPFQPASKPGTIGGVTNIEAPKLAGALKSCRDQHVRTPTNGHSAQVAFAKLFRSRNGGSGALVGAGFAASAVVSIGLDCLFDSLCHDVSHAGPKHGRFGGKLVLGALVRERELVQNPLDDTQFIDRNRQSFGGRLVVGDVAKYLFGFELLHQHATYQRLGTDNYTTYNATLDVKFSKGVWLTANYGSSSGANFGKSSQFTAGFKFAIQPSTSLSQ